MLEYARVDIGVFLIIVVSRVAIGSLSREMHVQYSHGMLLADEGARGAGTHDILGSPKPHGGQRRAGRKLLADTMCQAR